MKYLVTGGAGFIGRNIVNHLLQKNHNVIILDNLSNGDINRLNSSDGNFEFIKDDIRKINNLKNKLNDIDGIFHQAALIDVQKSFTMYNEYHDVNVNGTKEIFEFARSVGVKVVFASSASTYGNVKQIPIKENFVQKPTNPYGITKLKCENLAKKFWHNDVNIIGLRYFNVFGVGQSNSYSGVINKFLKRILDKKPPIIFGDGNQTRDFISVSDVADINLKIMSSDVKNNFFNVGSGEATRIIDLANMIMKFSNNVMTPIFKKNLEGNIEKSQADITNLQKIINYKIRISLKKWVKEQINEQKDFKNFY